MPGLTEAPENSVSSQKNDFCQNFSPSNRESGFNLERDLFDLNLGVRLSVTDLLLFVLLGLVGHNVDLLALAVLYYVSRYCCTFYCGLAGLESVCCRYCENLVKDNSFAFSGIELLNEDDVSFVNLVLLSACFNDCKHSEKHLTFFEKNR